MQDVAENFLFSNLMEIQQKNKGEDEFDEIDIDIEKEESLEQDHKKRNLLQRSPYCKSNRRTNCSYVDT